MFQRLPHRFTIKWRWRIVNVEHQPQLERDKQSDLCIRGLLGILTAGGTALVVAVTAVGRSIADQDVGETLRRVSATLELAISASVSWKLKRRSGNVLSSFKGESITVFSAQLACGVHTTLNQATTLVQRTHDVVATLNQRHSRWFNVAATSCVRWVWFRSVSAFSMQTVSFYINWWISNQMLQI